jgi:Na+-driven multidrug efflux pump
MKPIFLTIIFWIMTFIFGWGITSRGIFTGVERVVMSLLFGIVADCLIAIVLLITWSIYNILSQGEKQ